jgi:hypothetical protein
MASQQGSWKYNPVTGVVLILIAVGAIVGMFLYHQRNKTRLGPTQTIVAVCEETGKVFHLDVPTDNPVGPYLCPETGRETAWFAIKCQNCGWIYPMKETPADKVPCPNCGMRVPTVPVILSIPEDRNKK